MNEKLYYNVIEQKIEANHVCEVGVWKPESSNILLFIKNGVRADLIEPDPLSVKELRDYFKDFNNVSIHNYAIYDRIGEIELFRKGASTFVGELPSSPALVNDNYHPDNKDSFISKSIPFGELDDGTIDILSVDTEGCEWFVLMSMKSRPSVISLETHGKNYINPFIDNINEWILKNNYAVWYKDKSDTVYYLKDKISIETKGCFGKLFGIFHK